MSNGAVMTSRTTATKKPFYRALYFHVLVAILLGVLLGHFMPSLAVQMKPLGDAFIKLIKMVIGPIIFCTVVTGIAGMGDMKKVGRVGGKRDASSMMWDGAAALGAELACCPRHASIGAPSTAAMSVAAGTEDCGQRFPTCPGSPRGRSLSRPIQPVTWWPLAPLALSDGR